MKLCKRCQHSWNFDFGAKDETVVQMIDCTLNPVWEKVRSNHFCSQHQELYATPAGKNQYATEPAQYWKEAEKQKQRAIAAETKLKAANAKIRALKAAKNA